VVERRAVAHVYAVGTPRAGRTTLVAGAAEQTRQTVAVAEHSVAEAARAVLRTSTITLRAEVTCTQTAL